MQDQREEQYIEEEALRKAEDYKIQTIGLVDVSDGQDQYLLVEDNTDGFPDQTSLDILWRYVRHGSAIRSRCWNIGRVTPQSLLFTIGGTFNGQLRAKTDG